MRAILQVADTGPLESLVVMLRSIGWKCYLPDQRLKTYLRRIGCDTVLDANQLVQGMGYDHPFPIEEANPGMMSADDVIYIDVKAQYNAEKIWSRWPNLVKRTLWYRINGCKPENVPGCGNEIDPICPVITPNLWYRTPGPWQSKSYTFWPPFNRFDDYLPKHPRPSSIEQYTSPNCLIHKINGWGYQDLVPEVRRLGVKCLGVGSPDGLLSHSEIPSALSSSLAMVHLKSNDAPGYALYEALSAGCPIVCSRRLIWRTLMHDLLIPGETCLVFDKESHDPLSTEDIKECSREIEQALTALKDVSYNTRIGLSGRATLEKLMWKPDRDASSLASFLLENLQT